MKFISLINVKMPTIVGGSCHTDVFRLTVNHLLSNEIGHFVGQKSLISVTWELSINKKCHRALCLCSGTSYKQLSASQLKIHHVVLLYCNIIAWQFVTGQHSPLKQRISGYHKSYIFQNLCLLVGSPFAKSFSNNCF